MIERLLERGEVVGSDRLDCIRTTKTEEILAGLDLFVVLPLRAIQDAGMGTAEADQRPKHLGIMERKCPCHEAAPVVADEHEAVVTEVLDEARRSSTAGQIP